MTIKNKRGGGFLLLLVEKGQLKTKVKKSEINMETNFTFPFSIILIKIKATQGSF